MKFSRALVFVTLLALAGFSLPSVLPQTPAPQIPLPKPELVVQSGHSGIVDRVAFSPDGRWLASTGWGSVLLLRELSTGREVHRLRGRYALAFSRDGQWMASDGGSDFGSITLWDAKSGREIRTFDSPSNAKDLVTSLAFSPDGRILASAWQAGTVKLWDVTSSREIRTIDAPSVATQYVTSVAFSPDGRILASSGPHGTVKLWDIAKGGEVLVLTEQEGDIASLSFSPDGKHLASETFHHSVKLFEIPNGREVWAVSGRETDATWTTNIAFSADGKLLALANGDAGLTILDGSTGQKVWSSQLRCGPVNGVSLSADSLSVAAACSNGMEIWNTTSWQQVRFFPRQILSVENVSLSQDGGWLATMTTGYPSLPSEKKIWDLTTGRQVQTSSSGSSLGCFTFANEGRWLVSSGLTDGAEDNSIHIWDVISGRETKKQAFGNDRYLKACTVHPEGRLLAVAGFSEIWFWDLIVGSKLRSIRGATGSALAFSPDGKFLVSAKDLDVHGNGPVELKVHEVETGNEVSRAKIGTDFSFPNVLFSPDGRTLAIGNLNGSAKLVDLGTLRELLTLPPGPVAFSRSGDSLATRVGIYELPQGRLVHPFKNGDTLFPFSILFGPRSEWVATANMDGTTRIWDSGTGEQLISLVAMYGSNEWLAVTPDGLFDGSEQGMQKLVAWRIGNRVYPPDRFFADFYTPGLLARIVAGERPKPTIDFASLKLPPDVRITSPTPTAGATKQGHSIVTIEAQDQGGGVSEVRLYQNGKLVGSREGTRGVQTSNYAFEVDLVSGENLLKAVAVSSERVESNDDQIRLVYEVPEPAKPALHLLVVGINRYEDSAFNLGYARQDGEAIAHFFEQRGRRLFKSVNTITLFDDKATGTGIREALDRVAREARPEDVVLLYMAGHGVGLGQQFYFLPHEMHTEMDTEGAIRKYGLAATVLGDALRRIPALKQILILDTCQSETALPILAKLVMFRGMRTEEAKAAQMLARANGVYLIAASTKQQYAAEVPELGHGVLTYALLSGLGEKGPPQAPTSGEGMVTIYSLLQYVNLQVPELTQKYHRGDKQYPVSFNTGMDFPLVVR